MLVTFLRLKEVISYSSSDMVRRYQTDQLGNSNSDQLATKGPHFCHSSFSAYMSSPSSPTVPESNRKRPFSYDDASGKSTSRRRFGHSYLRLCLHERSLGAVIGKSGYLVDQIKVHTLGRLHCRPFVMLKSISPPISNRFQLFPNAL